LSLFLSARSLFAELGALVPFDEIFDICSVSFRFGFAGQPSRQPNPFLAVDRWRLLAYGEAVKFWCGKVLAHIQSKRKEPHPQMGSLAVSGRPCRLRPGESGAGAATPRCVIDP
jgi:hypothetical protein